MSAFVYVDSHDFRPQGLECLGLEAARKRSESEGSLTLALLWPCAPTAGRDHERPRCEPQAFVGPHLIPTP